MGRRDWEDENKEPESTTWIPALVEEETFYVT
jgi:hypothetical protein